MQQAGLIWLKASNWNMMGEQSTPLDIKLKSRQLGIPNTDHDECRLMILAVFSTT